MCHPVIYKIRKKEKAGAILPFLNADFKIR